MKATISLGSNLGDRFQYLQNSLDALNAVTGTQVHSVSPVFETDPVGGPEQGRLFLGEDCGRAVPVSPTCSAYKLDSLYSVSSFNI
jgi:hypothetical protein